MTDAAERLLHVLDSLGESSQFCVSGSVSPVLPGLEVKGVGPVGIPISPATARQLIEQATQAPYGRGEETIVDTEVRRVWQIEPTHFALHNPEWDTLIAGILEKVKTEFGIDGQVLADLYKLLIYEQGSFFAPHRDTEKRDGMFATLVVCLPARHEGGTLLVSHDRQTRALDFSGPQGEYQVQYAAFYTDCRHEIKPITQGYRVCLVYNLALAQQQQQPEAPRASDKVEQVAGLLAELFADGALQKIVLPQQHEYTEAGLSFDMLKGADRACVDVLRRAAELRQDQLYLALMTYHQTGDVDYSTVRYSRRGYDVDNSSARMGEVFQEELALNHWIDSTGQEQAFGKMPLREDEILTHLDFEDFPIEQSVHEATGNEGVTMQRWYRQAAVVLWPPERYFGILAGQGQASAIPALEKLVAGTADPSSDAKCRTFAREILGRWQALRYPSNELPLPAAMLQLLEQIANPDLVNQFLRDVLPRDYRGTEGESLRRLADRLGWETFAEGLTRFVAGQDKSLLTAKLPATVSIVAELCRDGGKMTPERKTVCRAVATELENLIRKWDTGTETQFWSRKGDDREGIIESLTGALSAIGEGELLGRFLTHALADKAHYGLHAVLIPAVKSLSEWPTKDPIVTESRHRLLQHCIGDLERLTATPVAEPTDWAQDITLRCGCADCRELQQFLHDPQQTTHRFRVAEARRRHLHQQSDSHHCDMSHLTERKGSPYTLVCTKNRASYERKKAEFATNVRLLKELHALERPKRKR